MRPQMRKPSAGGSDKAMLRVHVLTIFPRMIEAPLAEGIVARAASRGAASVTVHDLRDFTEDRHRTTDDAPFGGGPGMVMKGEPFFRALDAIGAPAGTRAVVLLSPRGRRFDQKMAERFALLDELVLLCGRYEGIDERVAQSLVTEEVSLGDFVLTGGETAALAVIEASVRLVPGALGDQGSAEADSFADGVLDFPHYTRPAVLRGLPVPEALLSGDHERVRLYRRKESLRATRARRPDLLASAPLSAEDRRLLREIEDEELPSAAQPQFLSH
jgi:tRNA (guanine37-N1)-methyltransferase